MREDSSEEWLEVLLVVSYAGMYGIEIDATKLYYSIPVKNKRRMVFLFEQEYLLKTSTDNKKINSLHALRARKR
ncbi:hypothetical protein [Gracilibacillus saliphilus]|uniref:hypothetical protein n=1 Tax=Gracilibacillus saliphilus TaxID=543890 RepID=UPI001EE3783F|nr:hypothetical protein [Gracilibacillus saliphilus]